MATPREPFDRERAWWDSLTPAQRDEVRQCDDALPEWLVDSLAERRLLTVEAELPGHSPVHLMSTRLRDFIEHVTDPKHEQAG